MLGKQKESRRWLYSVSHYLRLNEGFWKLERRDHCRKMMETVPGNNNPHCSSMAVLYILSPWGLSVVLRDRTGIFISVCQGRKLRPRKQRWISEDHTGYRRWTGIRIIVSRYRLRPSCLALNWRDMDAFCLSHTQLGLGSWNDRSANNSSNTSILNTNHIFCGSNAWFSFR